MKMVEDYVQRRIQAIESELGLLKRARIRKPTEEEIRKRIERYEKLVERTSKALKVTEDPDAYIARLRAKEY